jgi:5,10-methylenetetrahydromethanopterin reductase
MVPAVTQGAIAAGRDPGAVDISGCAWLSLSADPSGPTDVLRDMVAYFGWALEAPALETIGLTPADFAPIKALIDAGEYGRAREQVTDQMCRLAISGTPKQVIAQIEKLAGLGITQVNLGGPLGPDPAEAIRLMGEEVIPWFR